jgi:DNA-directed DNA polymerase III PolC
VIVHLDADAFFASVEQAADSKLRGKAMAVGGQRRGIIASASYEARKMGVYTPMPTARARQICPKLIVVPGDYGKYEQFSKFMFSFAGDYTPTIEVGGLDEGYLDLTANRNRKAVDAAAELRKTIHDVLKIGVSFGIGQNKLVAQIASKLHKPHAFREVSTGSERQFLNPLVNRWLPGVGPKVGTTLDAAGLTRIEQIAATPPDMLSMFVGSMAPQLVRYARGEDDRPVIAEADEAKSYGEQQTFGEDVTDEVFLRATLRQMADRLMAKVREDGKAVRTVAVTIKYNDFDTNQRSQSLDEPTDLASDLYSLCDHLLARAWERRVSLRMVLLRLSQVYEALPALELPLSETEVSRTTQSRVAGVIDDLRTRFGPGIIMHGHDLWLSRRDGKPRSDLRKRPSRAAVPAIRQAPSAGSTVPLGAKSYYSFLDSLMSPSDIVAFAAERGSPAVAITDPNLHGAVEFYVRAKEAGIKPIIGAELTIHRGNQARRVSAYVENSEGYSNLCRLLSQARIAEQDYADQRTGLCVLPSGTTNPEWRYKEPKQSRDFQIVGSIRTLTLLNEAHPAKRVGDFSFQPGRLSADEAKAVEGLVDRCNFDFEINTLRFPRWSPPDGSSPAAFLRRIAFEGLHRRYRPPNAKQVAQLETELKMIATCGYDEYFLTVWDLLQDVREAGIDWICRGSAADSLTIYCLGISNFCPVRFEMYFQRFLNEERMKLNKLPDIDLDFPWDKRDQVAQMVFDKYGKEHAAIVGGFSTFQGRSALAEVGKVLGISDRDIRRVTEHIPHMGAAGIKEALDSGIESRGTVYSDEPYTTAMKLAAILDGFPRYPKMHPCGVVISRDPIRDISPTFPSAKNPAWPVTHYNMESCEQVGLIKLDLLSQAGLSVMRDTVGSLKEKGIPVDLSSLEPWDDPQVWDMISRGEARSVHHIESPAMCSLSKACQPQNIDVLVAIVSVIRPGAANGGRKASFAARACGIEPTEYVHPSLEQCLGSTYGVMAYEEHVPQICEAFAGMTPGRADVLRRALAKDKAKVIAEMKIEFTQSANGIRRTPGEIADVWELLTDFSGYSFNRAHSTAYALEAYESAFLKRYHPAEFIAKVLTHERGFYSALAYSVEARRLGLSFLPPDVNASSSQFHVEGCAIRVPIWKVKDLTQNTLIRIDQVKRRAPFLSLRDFCLRSGASAAEMENLIRIGAFDNFGDGRPEQVWQARQISQWPREGAQGILFRADSTLTLPDVTLSEPTALDRLKAEMELLGFTVGAHPLDLYPEAPLATSIIALGNHLGQVVTIIGMVIADRVFSQANGDPMKFITICDRTGIVETELFASQYRWFGLQTVRYPMIKVAGKVVPLANGKGFAFELIRIDPAAPPTMALMTRR